MICRSGEQIQIFQIYSFTKFNSLLANAFIFYPLKTSESLWFSGVFRGHKNGNIDQKWVKEVDRNNFNLLMIVNSVHVFNSLCLSLPPRLSLISSKNSTYCEKARLLTRSKYYVMLF